MKLGAPGGQIGPNQALEFEVELIDIKEGQPAPAGQPGAGGQGMSEEQIKALQEQIQAQAAQQQGK